MKHKCIDHTVKIFSLLWGRWWFTRLSLSKHQMVKYKQVRFVKFMKLQKTLGLRPIKWNFNPNYLFGLFDASKPIWLFLAFTHFGIHFMLYCCVVKWDSYLDWTMDMLDDQVASEHVSDSLIPRHGNVKASCFYWPSKGQERVVD